MKKPIWDKIQDEMTKLGFTRTGDQYKQKMKSLEKKYKEIKTKLNRSGEENDNSFPYYEIIDSVMGTNPTISPHFIIGSGAQDGLDLDDEDDFLLVDDNVCATSPVQASSPSMTYRFLMIAVMISLV